MSRRDPALDNAKMLLVTLVVVGHSWTLLPSEGLTAHLYDFLYAWHIPAFVLVTGYLSRSFDWTARRLWQLVRTVVVPYVVFEAVIALFRVHVGGERLEDLFADPHWPLWYLAALFFWRLMTPPFRLLGSRTHPAVAVAVAVALSLAAGLWAGDTLDLARVFGLLPFFVLGTWLSGGTLERLRGRWARVSALAVLVGIWVLTGFTDRLAATEWLYYRARYDELVASDLEALVIRGAVLLVGLCGAFAFLALVPRREGWFTRMGAATLVVYLFHGFVVLGAEYAGFPTWVAEGGHQTAGLLLTTVAAVAVSLFLAWPPVAGRLADVVDPFGWAERHAKHAVDLGAGAVVHTATLDQLEQRLEEHAEDEHSPS